MSKVRSKDSHTPGTDTKLEIRLNVKDLETLQEAFSLEGDGHNDLISLTRDQFVEALGLVLSKGSRDEYSDLFDKIDITREGRVDWEKFASHMLLEFYEKDDRIKSLSLPQWKELKTLPGPHKDIIQKIVYLKNSNRYLTMSKEGSLAFWGSDIKLQNTVKTITESCRPKDLWVTDFITMSNVNKMAVGFTSKEIDFYDSEMNCKIRLQNIPRIPLCMDYWYNPENPGEALMVWGDTDGYINVLLWYSIGTSIFERISAKAADKDENIMVISLKDISQGLFKSVTFIEHLVHKDWVRKVSFLPNLECFVSCATNSRQSMVICWLEKHNPSNSSSSELSGSKFDDLNISVDNRRIAKISVFEMLQGINSFVYNESLNLIATAGVNFHVCLWNPYVFSKPNGLLRGHMASVTDVQFHRLKNLLFSFSKDKVLRIWDVQLQVCIHRVAGIFPKGQEATLSNPKLIVYSRMFFHEDKLRLFITFNYGLTMLEMKPDNKDKIQSHEKPLIGCLFNSLYNQIVTACTGGTVYCWMIDTGQRVKTISDICSPGAELTCITQDITQTRLYTGATDGLVKIYDFNGHCYHTLVCDDGNPADISQIVILKRCVLVFGFSRFVTPFWTSNFRDHKVYPSKWKGTFEHEDDILAGTPIPPHSFVSGAYNGEIIVWNCNSEQASRIMNQRCQNTVQQLRNLTDQYEQHQNKIKLKSIKRTAENQEISSSESSTTTKKSTYSSTPDPSSSSPYLNDASTSVVDTISEMNLSFGEMCPECVGVTVYRKMDCMFNVSRLIYLDARKSSKHPGLPCGGANLVSCGGNGIVRFWNATDASLIGEFVAHENASSIIMSSDASNSLLATCDMDGLIKLWDISQYCLTEGANMALMIPPPLKIQWQAHTDEISGVSFCLRYGRNLVLTSSADQSAALWETTGQLIGRLGQEHRWKLSKSIETPIIEADSIQLEESTEDIPSEYHIDPYWEPDPEATKNPAGYRMNTWENTTLGKDYKELRTSKRERIQPTSIPDMPYLQVEASGKPSFGPFYSLKVSQIEDIEDFEKPDFMNYQEKFFKETPNFLFKNARVPLSSNDLRAVFDERSLFTRDYDNRHRFKTMLNEKSRYIPSDNLENRQSKSSIKLQPIKEKLKLKSQKSQSPIISQPQKTKV